jgi:hygromycin-B 7''-O-kinase
MAFPPSPTTEADWDTLLADDSRLREGVAAIAQRHGLHGAQPERYDSGSLPVYALGEQHVLKLFPPPEGQHAAVEARTLAHVQGRLPLPTPELIASGTLEGWHYLLMSRLHGRRLVDVWPELSPADRDRFASELGEGIAALHALDTTGLHDLEPHWPGFIRQQHQSAVERQRQRGLGEAWLEQIPGFLQAWQPPPPARLSLLHTEIMREHLVAMPGPGGWQLAGLFDFEPAMLGAPEYDFASVGLFVACGDGRFLRRLLLAYGYADAALDEALQNRLMAHALLHRYSNLKWYLERLPPQGAGTLEALARRWWPLAPA